MDTFTNTVLTGLLVGGIYALLALGLILLYKATKIVNLAYGGVLVLGAYIGYEIINAGVPGWLGFVLAIVCGAIIGLVLYRFIARPMIGQSPLVIFILTLVVGVLIDALIGVIWGGQDKSLNLLPLKAVGIFGVLVNVRLIYAFGASLFLFIILVLLFRYTRVGLAMRCVSEDTNVSQSLGINVKRIFAVAWMVTCAVAVASGILYGAAYSVNPGIGSFGLLKGLPVILLGGMESILGALVGGIGLGLLEIFATQYIEPAIHYEISTTLAMFVMLIILLFRPYGLFGQSRIERI